MTFSNSVFLSLNIQPYNLFTLEARSATETASAASSDDMRDPSSL